MVLSSTGRDYFIQVQFGIEVISVLSPECGGLAPFIGPPSPLKCGYFFFFFFVFYILVLLSFRATLAVCGGSQARGPIGNVATGLCQSHSNT